MGVRCTPESGRSNVHDLVILGVAFRPEGDPWPSILNVRFRVRSPESNQLSPQGFLSMLSFTLTELPMSWLKFGAAFQDSLRRSEKRAQRAGLVEISSLCFNLDWSNQSYTLA